MFRRSPLSIAECSLAGVMLLTAAAAGQQAPQNDTDDDNGPKHSAYVEQVRADKPVAWWRFESADGVAELEGSPWKPAERAPISD